MRLVTRALSAAMLLVGLASPRLALAASNDFALWKLGPPDQLAVGTTNIAADPLAQERFARFVGELGMVMAPLPSQPPSSLGQAGFEVTLSEEVANIHPSQTFSNGTVSQVWPTVGTPPNSLYLTTLHVRKGLPLSLELDADVSYIGRSSLVIPSVALKWTLLEGIKYVPDIDIRAYASVLLGAPSLTVVVAGWDLGVGYRFPIIGSSEIAVYAGYQMIGLDATTTNIPFDPNHIDNSNPNSDDDVFAPLSLNNPLLPSTRFNRVYFGAEFRWNVLVAGMDFGDSFGTNPIETATGENTKFSVQLWKFGFRGGVVF